MSVATLSVDPADLSAQRYGKSTAERAAERSEKRAERARKRAAHAAERRERHAEQEERRNEDATPGDSGEADVDAEGDDATQTTSGTPLTSADSDRETSSSSSEGAIVDEELSGVPAASSIEDPELSGATTESSSTGSFNENNTGKAQLVLRSRFAGDLYRADPREEVWENVTLAVLDTTLRRSESLRFVLGVRARFRWAALAADVPDAQADRVELDAAPTAGYIDVTLGDGVHLQLGYQPVHLGRFDLLSATDVLAVNDLREGTALFPELGEIGQLAARLDYNVNSWLGIRAIYVPFFSPHILSVTESDFGLFRMNQATIDAGLSELNLTGAFAANLSRADRARIAETTLATFAPSTSLSAQQAALRLDVHGTVGELAMTVATALEHLPSFRASQELIDATLDSGADAQARLAAQPRPVTVEYDRFVLLSVDGSIDIAPLQVGVELAYMLNRTMWAVGDGPFPLNVPVPERANIAHAGLRVEYVKGESWFFVMESFFSYVLSQPTNPQFSWMFLEDQHWVAGVGTAASWLSDFGLAVELAAFALSDRSIFFTPRVIYELLPGFEVEVGAFVVEGDNPPPTITPNLAFGGMFDTVDAAFVGVRYAL